MTEKQCGTCNACCNVYNVPDVPKAEGEWCKHCDVGKGCRIYEQRPPACVEYECLWKMIEMLPVEFRPDNIHVVFNLTSNPRVVDAVTMPNYSDAWKRPQAQVIIATLHRKNIAVSVGAPNTSLRLLLRPDGTVAKIKLSPPDKDGIRWGEDK